MQIEKIGKYEVRYTAKDDAWVHDGEERLFGGTLFQARAYAKIKAQDDAQAEKWRLR